MKRAGALAVASSSTTALPRVSSRPVTITAAPCWANSFAASLPTPDVAPVTSTFLPLNFIRVPSLWGVRLVVVDEIAPGVHPLSERRYPSAQDRLDVTGEDRGLLHGGRVQRDVGVS